MPHPTTATLIRDLPGHPNVSDQKLWRLDHPIPYRKSLPDPKTGSVYFTSAFEEGETHFIVSSHACSSTLVSIQGQGEVYLFPSDENGTILDWSELPGSQKGDVPHQNVIDDFLASFKE